MPRMGGYNLVALRGLILYIVCRKACIYNPATRQCITLPAVKSKIFSQEAFRKHVHYFFGHDPVLDQYKVVCSVVICSELFERMTSEHWVLVLEAGGLWKRIEFDQPHFPKSKGLCIDGVVYYLASTCMSRRIVVSFDVRCEEFNTFQVPHSLSVPYKEMGFIEYGGKPAIVDHTNLVPMGLVDLWVLEDGGKWSAKSMVLQPCQMHLVDNNMSLVAHGTTQNGEVILAPFPLLSPYYILYYDVQKNDLRKVRIRGIPGHWFGKRDKVYTTFKFYFSVMGKSESIMHLET